MSWFQIWTVAWQVSVFLTPLILGAAMLWLKSQFVTKTDAKAEANRINGELALIRSDAKTESNRLDGLAKADQAVRDQRYEHIRDKLGDHEGRLTAVEKDLSRPPTRHALNNELTKVVASNAALAKQIDGIGDQMKTVQTYLHTIIDRGLDGK